MTASERIHHAAIDSWSCELDAQRSDSLCAELERGSVILLPRLPFRILPGEERFLSDAFATEDRKNVNIRPGSPEVRGARGSAAELDALGAMVGTTQMCSSFFQRCM